jgi:hypothetical protein
LNPPRIHYYANQNSKISIRGKLGGFAIAQPDLANGTRFQVLMKERYPYYHNTICVLSHTKISGDPLSSIFFHGAAGAAGYSA